MRQRETKRDLRSLYVSRYLECRLKNSEAAVGFLLLFFFIFVGRGRSCSVQSELWTGFWC
jgi:hypothetical protein